MYLDALPARFTRAPTLRGLAGCSQEFTTVVDNPNACLSRGGFLTSEANSSSNNGRGELYSGSFTYWCRFPSQCSPDTIAAPAPTTITNVVSNQSSNNNTNANVSTNTNVVAPTINATNAANISPSINPTVLLQQQQQDYANQLRQQQIDQAARDNAAKAKAAQDAYYAQQQAIADAQRQARIDAARNAANTPSPTPAPSMSPVPAAQGIYTQPASSPTFIADAVPVAQNTYQDNSASYQAALNAQQAQLQQALQQQHDEYQAMLDAQARAQAQAPMQQAAPVTPVKNLSPVPSVTPTAQVITLHDHSNPAAMAPVPMPTTHATDPFGDNTAAWVLGAVLVLAVLKG